MNKEEKEILLNGYVLKIGKMLQMANVDNFEELKKELLEVIDVLDKIIILEKEIKEYSNE